jgi:hypothetical protein
MNQGYQNQLSSAGFNRQNSANMTQGIGSLLGGPLGFGMGML